MCLSKFFIFNDHIIKCKFVLEELNEFLFYKREIMRNE